MAALRREHLWKQAQRVKGKVECIVWAKFFITIHLHVIQTYTYIYIVHTRTWEGSERSTGRPIQDDLLRRKDSRIRPNDLHDNLANKNEAYIHTEPTLITAMT